MLYKQLSISPLEELDTPIGTGLDDILEKIRIHWEKDIERNRVETGTLLHAKVRTTKMTRVMPHLFMQIGLRSWDCSFRAQFSL